MRDGDILIIGGYGAVGRIIAVRLAEKFPGHVIVAGRNVVTRTLNLPSVSTWITFDPPSSAALMAFLRRSGLSKLLRYPWVEDLTVKLSTAVQHGSDKYSGQIKAQGEIDGRKQTKTVSISGNGQSRGTGLVTAQVVARLLSEEFPSGVFHSEQLFAPQPFIEQLTKDDIVFHENTCEVLP